jgi:hypothetical protein
VGLVCHRPNEYRPGAPKQSEGQDRTGKGNEGQGGEANKDRYESWTRPIEHICINVQHIIFHFKTPRVLRQSLSRSQVESSAGPTGGCDSAVPDRCQCGVSVWDSDGEGEGDSLQALRGDAADAVTFR